MKFEKSRRLFSSSKKVESANSPANSPSETNKKKPRPSPKEETRSLNRIFGFAASLKEFTKKHCKRAFSSDQVHSSVPLRSYLSFSCSNRKKQIAETSNLDSSLSLNQIKTRSLRVTLETCFSFRNDNETPVVQSHDFPELNTPQDSDKSKVSPSDSGTPENPKELEAPHQALLHMTSTPRMSFSGDSMSLSHNLSELNTRQDSDKSKVSTSDSSTLENPKELEAPHQALLHMTSAPRMSFSGDSISLSHNLSELNTRQDFDKSKVSTSDSSTPENPQELEPPHLQALLHMTSAPRMSFSHHFPELNTCQDSDKSKVSPPCDSGTPENPKELELPHIQALPHMASDPRKNFFGDNKSFSHELNAEGVRPFPLRKPDRSNSWEDVLNLIKAKFNIAKEEVNVDLKQFYEYLVRVSKDNAQSHHELKVIVGELMILTLECTKTTSGEFWLQCEKIVQELDVKRQELPPGVPKQLHTRLLFILTRCTRLLQFQSLKERWRREEEFEQLSQSGPLYTPHNETSCNRFPSLVSTGVKEAAVSNEQNGSQVKVAENGVATNDMSHEHMSIICRICEEDVPTIHLEDHSKICELADIYDFKGVSVDARLEDVALTLDNIIGNLMLGMKISNASLTREFDVLSAKLSDFSRSGSEDMLDCFGPKSDQGMTTSTASSMTTRSPRPHLLEMLLGDKVTFHDRDDIPLMSALANIARRAANAISDNDQSMNVLLSCLHDLRVTIDSRKFDALTVETFGTRIEKLIRDKYLQLNEILDDEKVDLSSTVIDEDVLLEDDVVRSLRTRSVHMRDRISIDDFEEIKEISRGAYGRVLLAKKKTTGDIFAIKVLKKADMIRKNAVECILAERDILINVRNPFVVRFFYSFTCRENLYLVMEYVNAGDFFSLLKSVGCLEEHVARVYIAEVVLALEYLHSQGVVHRDLKPDNLLMAHDGHVKLTDFGLSEVGLIDSTGDLSGPVLSEEKPKLQTSEHRSERRSARGTPDYLAPEILLGTGHGATADWWSVGIILFEFITGVPPFNADNPEQIFDNILDRKIPWPSVPEEMSYEARDLIDRLLAKDPHQRLGARGAAEVKQHIFFKDINWDTLPKQKAAFVPDTEDALDTSYFQSRYPSDKGSSPTNEDGKSCESGSSACLSSDHDDGVDELGGPAELETNVSENNPFDNFSYKNLSQLACINYDLVSKVQKHGTATTLYPRQTN